MVDDDYIAFINRFFRSISMKVTKRDLGVAAGTMLGMFIVRKVKAFMKKRKEAKGSKKGTKKGTKKRAA